MKVMIAYPPLEGKGCPMLGQNRQFQYFHNPSYIYPMVPASAATLLKENGHDVVWCDGIAEKLSYDQFLQTVNKEKPDLIAIETKTPVVKRHWKIINDLKLQTPNSRLQTVLFGDHVTALPEESMESCETDFVLTGGDYDFLLLNLCGHLEKGTALEAGIWFREGGKIKNTGHFNLDHDLDSLPFIDRDLTKWRLYGEKLYKRTPFTYTMVGRDCGYGKCKFCSWTTLYPKFRVSKPERLLDEVQMLVDKYGVREIFDDTGCFPSGGWLKRFCNGMIERGLNKKVLFSCNFRFDWLTPDRARLMKKAGFRLMKLGLESASQNTLDQLDKGTKVEDIINGCKIAKEAGLDVHLTIMVGYPWETREDALKTLKLASHLMLKGYAHLLQSTVVVPYPGTPLYEEAVKNNWLKPDPKDYESFDMAEPVFKCPDMSSQDIMDMCNGIYRIFLHPKYLWNLITHVRNGDDLRYLARGLKPVLGHIMDFKRRPGGP